MSILRSAGKANLDGDTEFGTVTHLTFPRLDVYNSVATALERRAGPLDGTGAIATGAAGSSMAYDSDGVLHVVYYDQLQHTLEYVTRSSTGELSQIQQIDPSTDDIGLAYEPPGLGMLKVATNDGSGWKLDVADPTSTGIAFTSLAFDDNNPPGISYYDAGPADLRYANFDGAAWSHQRLARKGAQG